MPVCILLVGKSILRQRNDCDIGKSMLSDEQIKRFQELWKQRFGEEISREEAYEKGAKLMRLVELTYKPMTHEEFELLQKRREETK